MLFGKRRDFSLETFEMGRAALIELINGRLSNEALVENANHESGHAVASVCLGIGPLPQGIELYPCGKRGSNIFQVVYGTAFTCMKRQGSSGPRIEAENSIQVLLAGPLAQFRLHKAYESIGWELDMDIPTRSFEIRLDGWQLDLTTVRAYLHEIPESERADTYARLLADTKGIVEQQLAVIVRVAEELSCQCLPHVDKVALRGSRIVEIFNESNHTQSCVIQDCSSL